MKLPNWKVTPLFTPIGPPTAGWNLSHTHIHTPPNDSHPHTFPRHEAPSLPNMLTHCLGRREETRTGKGERKRRREQKSSRGKGGKGKGWGGGREVKDGGKGERERKKRRRTEDCRRGERKEK